MANDRQTGFRTLVDIGERFVRRFTPGSVMGYDSGDPGGKTVQGDDQFPFVKDPADLAEARAYYRTEAENGLPMATVYKQMLELDPIDVRGFRTLTLFTNFKSSADPNPTIGIVPQAAIVFEGKGSIPVWVNYGVVDATLRGSGFVVGSLETSLEARSTAYRDCFAGQLDLSFDANAPRNIMLFLDVTPVAEVRLLVGSVARTSLDAPAEDIQVEFYYQLGR